MGDKKAKKEKKGKKARDPNAPKRPMGAYFLFMNDHRDATKAENPEMKIGEIAKILGQKWANLEKEEKEKYEEQAKEAKAKYEEEEPKAGGSKSEKMKSNGLISDI